MRPTEDFPEPMNPIRMMRSGRDITGSSRLDFRNDTRKLLPELRYALRVADDSLQVAPRLAHVQPFSFHASVHHPAFARKGAHRWYVKELPRAVPLPFFCELVQEIRRIEKPADGGLPAGFLTARRLFNHAR